MSDSPTCTVGPSAVTGERCGKPAVSSFTTSRGETFHECAEHDTASLFASGHRTTPHREAHPPTRTTRPFVLVRNGEIVGYADSAGPAVQKRAARLGAAIVPVTR